MLSRVYKTFLENAGTDLENFLNQQIEGIRRDIDRELSRDVPEMPKLKGLNERIRAYSELPIKLQVRLEELEELEGFENAE